MAFNGIAFNNNPNTEARLGAIEHEVMQYKAKMAMAQQDAGMMPLSVTGGSLANASGPTKEHQDLIDFNHKLMGMYKDLMHQHMDLMNTHQAVAQKIKASGARPSAKRANSSHAPHVGMAAAVSLGVIRLDYNYPPAPGDIDCPQSYAYDVYYRVVPGLTFTMCQNNAMTPDVEENFKKAVDYLVAKKVSGITGDCGFMMYFQKLARQQTSKPVFMSSLAQLPAVTCSFNQHELIAIFTANDVTLRPMRDLIKDECGVDPEERRYVIVGCQNVPGFEAVAAGGKVDVAKVTPGMIELGKKTLMQYPKIRAILLECTELPPYADALRAALRIPVYDAITCCNFFISGLQDNPLFGLNSWQKSWDGQQDAYKFGANLSAEDREKLVNKVI